MVAAAGSGEETGGVEWCILQLAAPSEQKRNKQNSSCSQGDGGPPEGPPALP